MKDLDFSFEQTPWEATLDTLRPGDTLPAARFLTLLEGEGEDYVVEAFFALEDRHIGLSVESLPMDEGSGWTAKRLRREHQLVGSGKLMQELEENDPLRLQLEALARVPATGDPQLLAQRCLDGDEDAMQLLANASLHLALETAMGLTGRGVLLMDLIQETCLGLWEGIINYSGGDFDSHIRWWVRQYGARAVTMQARQNGIGRKMRRGMEALGDADRQLLTRLGRNPTMEELAQELGISPDEAEIYQDVLQVARMLEKAREPVKEQTPEDEQAVEDTAYFQSRQRIAEMLSTLTEQEAKVLTLRFGLEGGQPCTSQRTAEALGITAEKVLALETFALNKLRNLEKRG